MTEIRVSRKANVAEVLEKAAEGAVSGPTSLGPGSLLNMELSNLSFQDRVVDMADDPEVPLLERVRFLTILGSNLDEFFMTRVAGFQRQIALGTEKKTLDGLGPAEQLRSISVAARKLLARVYGTTLPAVMAELGDQGIGLVRWDAMTEPEQRYIRRNYTEQLDAVITPLMIPDGSAFPHIRNLRAALLVGVEGEEREKLAVIELPNDVPRLVPLPGGRRFIPLEDVICANLSRLLYGRKVREAYFFRVTRSGNLTIESDSPDDLVQAVAENVARRPFQPVVRVEIDSRMPDAMAENLLGRLRQEAESRLSTLGEDDLYRIDGLIDLNRLQQIASLPLPDYRYPKLKRYTPLRPEPSIFAQLRRGDVLVRFPKHSFEATVERFVGEAATDPDVEAICLTLYRTNKASRIVRLLLRAHRNGKRVLAMIEVKASFDESRNIEWARTLEAAGIQVLYGPASIKVHAKIASVRRREEDGVRLYSYIGTGNLNASTAASYTDLGLLTADQAIGDELRDLFETMAGEHRRTSYEKLIVAPFNMRRRFLELIDRETEHALAGREAAIALKLNGLADREMIQALYRASSAGVRIDMTVRAICCLRPGVPGLSENIRVTSVVGRFLEHSRIYRFHNAGEPEYFIGSADWRGRNLSRRVEAVVPVRVPRHRAMLDRLLTGERAGSDHWDLQPDGSYRRRKGPS